MSQLNVNAIAPQSGSSITVSGNISATSQTGSIGRIEGDSIDLSGDLTARKFIVSSSVTNLSVITNSGSTAFGDSLDDTHIYTGSLQLTGSITASKFSGDGSGLSNVFEGTAPSASISTRLTSFTDGTATSVSGSSTSTGSFGRIQSTTLNSTGDITSTDGHISLNSGKIFTAGGAEPKFEMSTNAGSAVRFHTSEGSYISVGANFSALGVGHTSTGAHKLRVDGRGTLRPFGIANDATVIFDVDTAGNVTGSGNLEVAGNISGSSTSTGSFGRAEIAGNIFLNTLAKANLDLQGNEAIINQRYTNGGIYNAIDFKNSNGIRIKASSVKLQIQNESGTPYYEYSTTQFKARQTDQEIVDFSKVSGSSTSTGSFGRVEVPAQSGGGPITLGGGAYQDVIIGDGTGTGDIVLSGNSEATLRYKIGGAEKWFLRALDNDFIEFRRNSQNYFRIDGNGNVGINLNNDSPSERLHVKGNIFATGNISGSSTSTGSFGLLKINNTEVFGTTNGIAIGGGTNFASPSLAFEVTKQIDNNYVALFRNLEADAGRNFGLYVRAGTNTSDFALQIRDKDDSLLTRVDGTGNLLLNAGDVRLTSGNVSGSSTSTGSFGTVIADSNKIIQSTDANTYILLTGDGYPNDDFKVVSGNNTLLHVNNNTGGVMMGGSANATGDSVAIGYTAAAGNNAVAIGRSINAAASEIRIGESGATDAYLGQGNATLHVAGVVASGDITAQNFIVSSSVTSITYQSLSGSTIFGDTLDDTHQFTGSVDITGSATITSRSPLLHLNEPLGLGGDSAVRVTEDGAWRGGFIKYDGTNNLLKIGTHANNNDTPGDDITAIEITRNDGYPTFKQAYAYLNQYLAHEGDDDTYLRYQTNQIDLSAGGNVFEINTTSLSGSATSTGSFGYYDSSQKAGGTILRFGKTQVAAGANVGDAGARYVFNVDGAAAPYVGVGIIAQNSTPHHLSILNSSFRSDGNFNYGLTINQHNTGKAEIYLNANKVVSISESSNGDFELFRGSAKFISPGGVSGSASSTGSFGQLTLTNVNGDVAIRTNYEGGANVIIGDASTGENITTGGDNVVIGKGISAITGDNNVYIGAGAAGSNASAGSNVAVGFGAMSGGTGNERCVAIGMQTLLGNGNTTNSTAVGHQAGKATTTGEENAFFGYTSGDTNTTGDKNVTIGSGADVSTANAQNQIAIGHNVTSTGDNQTVIGNSDQTHVVFGGSALISGSSTSTGSFGHIMVGGGNFTSASLAAGGSGGSDDTSWSDGTATLISGSSTSTGSFGILELVATDGNAILDFTRGTHNVSIGFGGTGQVLTSGGVGNIFVGYGVGNAVTTGDQNVGLGYQAITGGNATGNTAVGYRALKALSTGIGNVGIGRLAADAVQSGNYNIAIGQGVGLTGTGATNQIGIGYDVTVPADNHTVIGAAAQTNVIFGGSDTTLSLSGSMQISGSGPATSASLHIRDFSYTDTHILSQSLVVAVDGNNGRLFSVTDQMTGSLFSANTVAGLPVIEAFSDNKVTLGPFSNQVIVDGSGNLSGSATSTGSFGIIENNTQIAGFRPIINQTANFSASLSNAGRYHIVHGNITCSIGTDSDMPLTTGAEFEFFQSSSVGNFLFETGSGVSLLSKNDNKNIAGQHSGATLKKVATNTFHLVGDLT